MSASASLLLLLKPWIYQILNFEFFFEQYLFSHNSQFINCNTIHMLQYSTLNLTYWQIDDVSIYCQTLLDFSLWYPFYYYIDKCVCLYYIHLDGSLNVPVALVQLLHDYMYHKSDKQSKRKKTWKTIKSKTNSKMPVQCSSILQQYSILRCSHNVHIINYFLEMMIIFLEMVNKFLNYASKPQIHKGTHLRCSVCTNYTFIHPRNTTFLHTLDLRKMII